MDEILKPILEKLVEAAQENGRNEILNTEFTNQEIILDTEELILNSILEIKETMIKNGTFID